jgi:hypothetical protein
MYPLEGAARRGPKRAGTLNQGSVIKHNFSRRMTLAGEQSKIVTNPFAMVREQGVNLRKWAEAIISLDTNGCTPVALVCR